MAPIFLMSCGFFTPLPKTTLMYVDDDSNGTSARRPGLAAIKVSVVASDWVATWASPAMTACVMVGPPSVVTYSTSTPCFANKPFSAATYTGVNDGSTPVASRTTGFSPLPAVSRGLHAVDAVEVRTSAAATAVFVIRFMAALLGIQGMESDLHAVVAQRRTGGQPDRAVAQVAEDPECDDPDEDPVDAPVVAGRPDQRAEAGLRGHDLGRHDGEEAVAEREPGTRHDVRDR